MKYIKKTLALLLAATMLLTGCGSAVSKYGTKVAATYGDRTIYMDEANFWLRLTQLDYSYYVQMYAYYNGVDFWSAESGRRTQTYWESVKEDVMAQFLQINILLDHASEFSDIELTGDDYEKIANTIDKFKSTYGTTLFDEAVIGRYSNEALRESMARWSKATKVWHAVCEQATLDVKEEDCKSFTVNYFTVADSSSGTSESGTTLAGEDLANFLKSELSSGTSFESLKSTFSGITANTVSYRRTDSSKEGLAMFRLGKDLQDGEVAIEKSTSLWYIVQCVKADDEEATASARKTMEDEQKEAHFEEVYAEWKKSAKPFSVKAAYKRLTVSTD